MNLLFALGPERAPRAESLLTNLWLALNIYARVGVILTAIILVACGVFFGLRWLSRKLGARLWRLLLRGFTALSGVGFVGLGLWSHFLKDGKGTPFSMSSQAVHVGTVICGMGLVVGLSAVGVPYFLDAL